LDINNAGEGSPWSVRFWGHGELALTQLGIISDELTPETRRRIEEIKALFPECVVSAKTREEWRREMNLPNL
jgi:hypothetical protein